MSLHDLERRLEKLEQDVEENSKLLQHYQSVQMVVRWIFAILSGGIAVLATIKGLFAKWLSLS